MNSHLTPPVVTVSMASCNSELTVERAVTAVLNQDLENFELLIFDSKSSDRTREILNSFARSDERIQLHFHEKQLSWTSNAQLGLRGASGDYFMFLDADDYIAPNYLSQLIEKQQNERSIGAMGKLLHCDTRGRILLNHPAFGRTFDFAEHASRQYRIRQMVLTPEMYGSVNLIYSLWLTSELREIGLWSETKERRDDDYHFCLRALARGRIAIEPSTWICRSIKEGMFPCQNSLDLHVDMACQLSTLHQVQITDWTFPYLVQLARFMRDDWRNLTASLSVAVRVCIAIVALPKRFLRWRHSKKIVRSTHS